MALDDVPEPWTLSALEAAAAFGTHAGPVTLGESDVPHRVELSVSDVWAASIDGPEAGAPQCGPAESWFNLEVSWHVVFDDVVGSVEGGQELHVLEDGSFRVVLNEAEFVGDDTAPDVSDFPAVGDQPVDRVALWLWGDPGASEAELVVSFLPDSESRNVTVAGIWQGVLLTPN